MSRLFSPRGQRGLSYVDGSVTLLPGKSLPESLSRPVAIISDRDEYNLVGLESGKRSGLAEVLDNLYRIKGCVFAETPSNWNDDEPYGRQLTPNADNEIEHAERLAERLKTEAGITYVMNPLGYYDYNGSKGTRATIFEIEGDTRLDELLKYLDFREMFVSFVGLSPFTEYRDVLVSLGRDAGYTMRLMKDSGVEWGLENAHPGNFVVYQDDDRIRVVPVDLDCASFDSDGTHVEVKAVMEEILTMRDISGNGWNLNKRHPWSGREFGVGKRYTREWVLEGIKDGYYNHRPGDINLNTMLNLDTRLDEANQIGLELFQWRTHLPRTYEAHGNLPHIVRRMVERGLEGGASLSESIRAAEAYAEEIVESGVFVL
ncbi:MAG: hypothetical protein ABIJ92_00565 [Candidatus Aenigmatarchaeota archaeon]